MRAIVVYESLWGNTASVAQAIAAGIGPEARALPTDQATAAVVAGADLLVAGAPVIAFRLPTEKIRENIRANPGKGPAPDLSRPSMRSWLAGLSGGQAGGASAAAFETGLRWSPGGSTGTIGRELRRAGYTLVAKSRRFVVRGRVGPMREGELEKARLWGAELAKLATSSSERGA